MQLLERGGAPAAGVRRCEFRIADEPVFRADVVLSRSHIDLLSPPLTAFPALTRETGVGSGRPGNIDKPNQYLSVKRPLPDTRQQTMAGFPGVCAVSGQLYLQRPVFQRGPHSHKQCR